MAKKRNLKDSSQLLTTVLDALDSHRPAEALTVLLENIASSPSGFFMLRLATRCIEEMGDKETAQALLVEISRSALNGNKPIEALATLKVLEGLGGSAEDVIAKFVNRYAAGSECLIVGTTTPEEEPGRLPSLEFSDDVQDDAYSALVEEAAEVIRGGLQLMKPLTACSPIPLMSDLEPSDLHNVVKALELQIVRPGQRIYRAAANLPGVWWLVQGEVEIGSRGRAFSAIGQGAILGFEALLGKSAYLQAKALSACELLSLPLGPIAELLRSNRFRARVEAVAARYEVHRAVGRSKLFQGLKVEDHAGLLSRFVGYQIPEGGHLVEKGKQSPGLFLITWGEVELLDGAGTNSKECRLGVGEIVGLSGLNGAGPAAYTVIASTQLRALFLDADELHTALHDHPDAKPILDKTRADRDKLFSGDA